MEHRAKMNIFYLILVFAVIFKDLNVNAGK